MSDGVLGANGDRGDDGYLVMNVVQMMFNEQCSMCK